MKNTILLAIILSLVLVMRLFFYYQERHIYQVGETYKKTYSFMHEPKKNSTSQYFFADNLFVSIPLYPHFNYGDTVLIVGKVATLKTQKGSLLSIENPTVTVVKNHNVLLSFSKFVRERIEQTILTTISMREGGLLLGIILGVRDKIDGDFYAQLKNAGVLHVIAASGQNVSIVAALLLLTFERIVKRRYALLFTSLGVLFYSFIAGFDPPILRAAIMALVAYGALAFGRQNKGIFALLITAWIMIVHKPEMVEDVSFQLSFLSTFGILVIKPLIDQIINFRLISLLKDDITTTLSAQIATFPIMLATFGSYSYVTFPVNIVLLWTVPILMIFGGARALLGLVLSILGKPFVLLAYPFLAYFTGIIAVSDKFHYGLSIENLPQAVVAGYYLILIAVLIKFAGAERRKI